MTEREKKIVAFCKEESIFWQKRVMEMVGDKFTPVVIAGARGQVQAYGNVVEFIENDLEE